MTINISVPVNHELKPKITVFGVGGAGGNAVNNMITAHLEGVEFVVANTDAQSLAMSLTERRIQLGTALTQGLGAGARPQVGRAAAEESLESIMDHFQGTNMVFITAGMGGGTGTGGAPVIAKAARDLGILTVGVVTKPFHFEGAQRMRIAEQGIAELQQCVDTLIIIPNQNLFRIANEKTTFTEAFTMADEVLYSGVRGVTDLMVMPGLINLDFADVQAVMMEMGKAMMGTGEAEGDKRALDAAERAINNPLLDDVSLRGARGVLVNITGGHDMTLFEVDEACNHIREQVDQDANIIFGSTFDEALDGKVRVSVVATGIDVAADQQQAVLDAKADPLPRSQGTVPGAETSGLVEQPIEETPEEDRSQLDLIPEAMNRLGGDADPQPATASTATTANAPFIPPRAVEPRAEPAPAAQPAVSATAPLEEADFLNASPPPARTAPVRPGHSGPVHGLANEPGRQTAMPSPEPEEAARPSLLARMTGSIGRGMARGEAQDPQRREPELETASNAAPATATPAGAPDLDIPAFLRRQRN